MAATLKAPDEAARAALYQQAEAQLDKDSALIPVYYRVSARLIKPTVGGFTGKDPLDYTDVRICTLSSSKRGIPHAEALGNIGKAGRRIRSAAAGKQSPLTGNAGSTKSL